MRQIFLLTAVLLCAGIFDNTTKAQQTQGASVLVVYNANDAGSIDVANYYMAQRSIPAVNKCAITPSSLVGLDYAQFQTEIRTPIRTCLDAVGRDSILYIVFTYNTPYKIGDSPNSIS